MIRLSYVITGLDTGGAEMMLYRILSQLDRNYFKPVVICLNDPGAVGDSIESLGVPVLSIGMRSNVPSATALIRLINMIRFLNPKIIQTWMYHANLFGGIAAKFAGNIPVIWGIHNNNLDLKSIKRLTIWTARFCGLLSNYLPERIICCSEVSRLSHERIGYSSDKMQVIPNGFDIDIYKPDSQARFSVRMELRLPQQTILIGLIARFDPQKDHRNFIESAIVLHKKMPEVHFLLCGKGVSYENKELASWVENTGISNHFHLLGLRKDIPRIINSLDILASSSSGEAFSLVIGEAMACGVPCVVTNVGDSALIVGETGRVVTAKNPHNLAAGWQELINMGPDHRRELGLAARCRIKERYSLPAVVARYEELYEEFATNVRH